MPTLPRRLSLTLLLALPACGGDKNQSTTDLGTTGTTGDPLGGSTTSGVSGPATVPTTDPTTDPTADPPPTTQGSVSVTTNATTDATTGAAMTTGEPACELDIPTPGPCNGGKPKSATPRFTGPTTHLPGGPAVIADDPDEAFASSGNVFIVEPDLGGNIECDLFGDDCGPGEKCNAWASNGGTSWNATKCVPVAQNPDPIGAPCTVEGSNVSGIDSCAKGAMCWNVDPDTNMGHCVEQCTCSLDNPICNTPDSVCLVANEGVLALCVGVCDPLDTGSCKSGEVCVPNGGGMPVCAVDASGRAGDVGDACQFANGCAPGLLCGANNGQCDGAGCCTPYCDLDAPTCPDGLDCLPFFERSETPKCFEDLGVCFTQ